MRSTTREPSGAAFMLRCAQLGLSDDALAGMTIGMVFDMLTEQINDSYDYPIKGNQEDIKRIFG